MMANAVATAEPIGAQPRVVMPRAALEDQPIGEPLFLSDDEEEEPTYKISYIIHARASRSDEGKPEWRYRIRWDGYTPDDDTYEPKECIESEHGGKAYLNRFWQSTGVHRDVRQHAFGAEIRPSEAWVREQLAAEQPKASKAARDDASEDDEPLDARTRRLREEKILEEAQHQQTVAAREMINRLHAGSSQPTTKTTPKKRLTLADEEDLLSSGGVWTGMVKRQKTVEPGEPPRKRGRPRKKPLDDPFLVARTADGRHVDNPVVPWRVAPIPPTRVPPSHPHNYMRVMSPIEDSPQRDSQSRTGPAQPTTTRISLRKPLRLWERDPVPTSKDTPTTTGTEKPASVAGGLSAAPPLTINTILAAAPRDIWSEPEQDPPSPELGDPPVTSRDDSISSDSDREDLFGSMYNSDSSDEDDAPGVPWREETNVEVTHSPASLHSAQTLVQDAMSALYVSTRTAPDVVADASTPSEEGFVLHTARSISGDDDRLTTPPESDSESMSPLTDIPLSQQSEVPVLALSAENDEERQPASPDLFAQFKKFSASQETTRQDGSIEQIEQRNDGFDAPAATGWTSDAPSFSAGDAMVLVPPSATREVSMTSSDEVSHLLDTALPPLPHDGLTSSTLPDNLGPDRDPIDIDNLLGQAAFSSVATIQSAGALDMDSSLVDDFDKLYASAEMEELQNALGLSPITTSSLSSSQATYDSPITSREEPWSNVSDDLDTRYCDGSVTNLQDKVATGLPSAATPISPELPFPRRMSTKPIASSSGSAPSTPRSTSKVRPTSQASKTETGTRPPKSGKGKLNQFLQGLVKQHKSTELPARIASLRIDLDDASSLGTFDAFEWPSSHAKLKATPAFRSLPAGTVAHLKTFLPVSFLHALHCKPTKVYTAVTLKSKPEDEEGHMQALLRRFDDKMEIAVAEVQESCYILLSTTEVAETCPFLPIPKKPVNPEDNNELLGYLVEWSTYPFSDSAVADRGLRAPDIDAWKHDAQAALPSSHQLSMLRTALDDQQRLVIFDMTDSWHGQILRGHIQKTEKSIVQPDSMNVQLVMIHEDSLPLLASLKHLTALRVSPQVNFLLFGREAQDQPALPVIYPRNGRIMVTFTGSALAQDPINVLRALHKMFKHGQVDAYVRPLTLGIMKRNQLTRMPKFDKEGRPVDGFKRVLKYIVEGKLGLLSAPPLAGSLPAVEDWVSTHNKFKEWIEMEDLDTLTRICEQIVRQWEQREDRLDLVSTVAADLRQMMEQKSIYTTYRRFVLIGTKEEVREASTGEEWRKRLEGIELMNFKRFLLEFPGPEDQSQ